MKTGLREATIRVFDPGELAPDEKQRLFSALEAFANLGDSLDEFLAFGKQNPTFFPVPILDHSQASPTPLPQPCFKGSITTEDGEKKIWHKAIAWEPVCHKLALFYMHTLRLAWHPPYPGPNDIATGESFEILMGLETGHGYHGREDVALEPMYAAHPHADILNSPVLADWKTGSFIYSPGNDFQRAVYILFREGWRAKVCARFCCNRRFIADKPRQTYCSTKCTGEAKSERNLEWWNKHGKMWRAKREASSRGKDKKLLKKRGK